MAMVQMLNCSQITFAEVADVMFKSVMSAGSKSKRIDVVFDVYWKNSIKNAERSRRGTSDVEYKNILAASKTPNWKTFLASPANKAQLINFFTCQFKQEAFRNQLQKEKELYITNGNCVPRYHKLQHGKYTNCIATTKRQIRGSFSMLDMQVLMASTKL